MIYKFLKVMSTVFVYILLLLGFIFMITLVRSNDEKKYLTELINNRISENKLEQLLPTRFYNLSNSMSITFNDLDTTLDIYIYEVVQVENSTLVPGITILVKSSNSDYFDDSLSIEIKSNNKSLIFKLHPLLDYSFSIITDETYQIQFIKYSLFETNGEYDKIIEANFIDYPYSIDLGLIDQNSGLINQLNDYYNLNNTYPKENYNDIGVVETFTLKISMVNTIVYGSLYLLSVVLGSIGIFILRNKKGSIKPTKNLKKDIENNK